MQSKKLSTYDILAVVFAGIAVVFSLFYFNFVTTSGSTSIEPGLKFGMRLSEISRVGDRPGVLVSVLASLVKIAGAVVLGLSIFAKQEKRNAFLLLGLGIICLGYLITAFYSASALNFNSDLSDAFACLFANFGLFLGSFFIYLILLAPTLFPICIKKNRLKVGLIVAGVLALLALIFCIAGISPFGYSYASSGSSSKYYYSSSYSYAYYYIGTLLQFIGIWFCIAFACAQDKLTDTLSKKKDNQAASTSQVSVDTEQLVQLKELLDSGVLNQAEYDEQKKHLLGL